jgi:molecular chaperone IbpA
LIVRGHKPEDQNRQYLYRGIASGSFERRFELADHVNVAGATMVNGILTVELAREIPEAMKPRKIEIGEVSPHAPERNRIEQKHAA